MGKANSNCSEEAAAVALHESELQPALLWSVFGGFRFTCQDTSTTPQIPFPSFLLCAARLHRLRLNGR
jgi:hypothetical protein